MRRNLVGTYLLLGLCLAPICLWKAMPVKGASAGSAPSWNGQAAAHYLDNREVWWQQWPHAQRDHGTICISCHTVVPYAMARPGLRRAMGEKGMTAPEKIMMANVEKRVNQWSEMAPFYSDEKYGDGKAVESRATEAVLNVVILASYDRALGHLRPITRKAFDEAWALQEKSGELTGGWKWQDFHLGPWESAESGYQGAALLMVEAVNAPDAYARETEASKHLDLERDYLRKHYDSQPVVNQLYVLWASSKEPGLLTVDERKALLATIASLQQEDGGWRTMAIDKRVRIDQSPEPMESDGYATGLAVLAMEESGTPPSDKTLQRGLAWLGAHQEKSGAWNAASINKNRAPETEAAPFMSDAATGYALLALENAK